MASEVLSPLLLGTVSLGLVAWLIRSAIRHVLSKDIENYKMRLKAEADRINFENQIRFSRLHDKRGTVIAELYKKLVEAIRAAGSFVSPAEWLGEPTKEEKSRIAFKAMMDFYHYYDEHKIYFTPEVCVKLDLMFKKVFDPVNDFSFFVHHPEHLDGEMGVEKIKTWGKAWRSIDKEDVPEARKALEEEFRTILGVETSCIQKTG